MTFFFFLLWAFGGFTSAIFAFRASDRDDLTGLEYGIFVALGGPLIWGSAIYWNVVENRPTFLTDLFKGKK